MVKQGRIGVSESGTVPAAAPGGRSRPSVECGGGLILSDSTVFRPMGVLLLLYAAPSFHCPRHRGHTVVASGAGLRSASVPCLTEVALMERSRIKYELLCRFCFLRPIKH